MKLILFIMAYSLSACGLPSETRTALADAAVNELLYGIEQLQSIGIGEVEVSAEVLMGAGLVCRAASIGSPFLVDAINDKVTRDNLSRGADNQLQLTSIEEIQNLIHAGCEIVNQILVLKSEPTVDPPTDAES